MPLIRDDNRALATVEQVSEIIPIPNADNIEIAKIRGWNVVVLKCEFLVGDPVVYFEIDTALPMDDGRFSFLAPRGVKTENDKQYHVLKTARLRGVYSQGLALPLFLFLGDVQNGIVWSPGDDLTQELGLYKWEPPAPSVGTYNFAGPFLSQYASKTDSDRVQNLGEVWDSIQIREWIPTEKVDGTSMTVLRDKDGKIRVCGRNWEIKEGDNLYWRATHFFDLDDLDPEDVIQAEIVGPGIQGNPLGLSEVRPVVFTYEHNVRGVRHASGRDVWPDWAINLSAPVYDLDLPDTIEEAIEQANGIKSLLSPGKLAEGIVWHTVNGHGLFDLCGRSTFKVVSNKYLAKH